MGRARMGEPSVALTVQLEHEFGFAATESTGLHQVIGTGAHLYQSTGLVVGHALDILLLHPLLAVFQLTQLLAQAEQLLAHADIALLVLREFLSQLVDTGIQPGLLLVLDAGQPSLAEEAGNQQRHQCPQQQPRAQKQPAFIHGRQISCNSAHSSSVIIFSRSTRISSSSSFLHTPCMNLAASSVPACGAVSISDCRRSTTSATLSTRMPPTWRSASMLTIRVCSLTGAGARPKRW